MEEKCKWTMKAQYLDETIDGHGLEDKMAMVWMVTTMFITS